MRSGWRNTSSNVASSTSCRCTKRFTAGTTDGTASACRCFPDTSSYVSRSGNDCVSWKFPGSCAWSASTRCRKPCPVRHRPDAGSVDRRCDGRTLPLPDGGHAGRNSAGAAGGNDRDPAAAAEQVSRGDFGRADHASHGGGGGGRRRGPAAHEPAQECDARDGGRQDTGNVVVVKRTQEPCHENDSANPRDPCPGLGRAGRGPDRRAPGEQTGG